MLTILYRDDQLIAIDKPSGLLVHRSDVDRSETRFAVQLLRDQIGCRVHPVHRLDRGTSGVLLFAFTAATAAALSAQFQRGEVAKRYLAVVRGWPADAGLIDRALRPVADAHVVTDEAAAAQDARTAFRTLGRTELPFATARHPTSRYALLLLDPLTGRRHQLRRHLKHLAHPIIGDATYGKGEHNRWFARTYGADRMLLHCWAMSWRCPVTGAPAQAVAPPQGRFFGVLRALGWQGLLPDEPLAQDVGMTGVEGGP